MQWTDKLWSLTETEKNKNMKYKDRQKTKATLNNVENKETIRNKPVAKKKETKLQNLKITGTYPEVTTQSLYLLLHSKSHSL